MKPKINVIVWSQNYAYAYTFVRSVVNSEKWIIIIMVNGAEVVYSSCGIRLDELPKGLPRDAKRITTEKANELPTFTRYD